MQKPKSCTPTCALTCKDGHMDLDWALSWPFAGVPAGILGLDVWYNQRTFVRHIPGRSLYGSATSLRLFDQHHWGISGSSERPFGAATLLLMVRRISTQQNLLASASDHDISSLLCGRRCRRKIRLSKAAVCCEVAPVCLNASYPSLPVTQSSRVRNEDIWIHLNSAIVPFCLSPLLVSAPVSSARSDERPTGFLWGVSCCRLIVIICFLNLQQPNVVSTYICAFACHCRNAGLLTFYLHQKVYYYFLVQVLLYYTKWYRFYFRMLQLRTHKCQQFLKIQQQRRKPWSSVADVLNYYYCLSDVLNWALIFTHSTFHSGVFYCFGGSTSRLPRRNEAKWLSDAAANITLLQK